MSIIIQRPWTRQPPASVLINRAHPLAKKFDTFVNFNGPSGLRNLITQGEAVTSTVAGFSPTVNGLGVTSTGSGRVALNQVGNYTSGSFFLAFQIRLDSAAGSPVLIYKGPYAGAGYYTQLSASNEILFFCGGNYATTSANALVAGQTATVVITGTVGTTSWDIYVDGVNLTSFRPTLTPTTSSNSLDLLAYGGGTSNYTSGAIIWFGCGPNLLSQAEASRLARRPWNLFAPLPRRIWVPVSVSGGGTTVSVPAGSLTITGNAPTVLTPRTIAVPKGELTLTGNAPTVSTPIVVSVPVGSLSLTGFAPTVVTPRTIPVPAGTLSLTGFAPTVTAGGGQVVQVPAGSIVLTGYAPVVVAPRTISVPAGSLTITGYAPTVLTSTVIPVPAGSLTLTGFAPSVVATANKYISVPSGTLTLTGYAPTVSSGSLTIYFWKRTA